MEDIIQALNRNTIAAQNGGRKDDSAMERFCALILELRPEATDAYRNRLELISCCETLSPELKDRIEHTKQEIDRQMSKNEYVGENTKVR